MPEQRLIRVELPEEAPAPSAYAEADRRQAIADLLHHNRFDPVGQLPGPYVLGLAVREGRLVFDIRNAANETLHVLALALGPFRRLIKDYHMVVEAHEQAVKQLHRVHRRDAARQACEPSNVGDCRQRNG